MLYGAQPIIVDNEINYKIFYYLEAIIESENKKIYLFKIKGNDKLGNHHLQWQALTEEQLLNLIEIKAIKTIDLK